MSDKILDKIENLIDDIERDESMTFSEILNQLEKIKDEIIEINLEKDENTINWEDLD